MTWWLRALTGVLLVTGCACVRALPAAGDAPAPKLNGLVLLAAALAGAGVGLLCRARGGADGGSAVRGLIDRLATPTPGARFLTGGIIFVFSAITLYGLAWLQGREFSPKWSDEYMHLVQMRMLAHGRLWMPEHPLADFFETYFVFVRPVYASMYFPGASLLYLPTIWLNLPTWLMPLLASAALVAMLYRVVAELIDGVSGWLGAALLIATPTLRYDSLLLTSHVPVALLGVCLVWSWLRWRRHRSAMAAALMGGFAGWLLITRPVDGVCYILPVAAAVVVDIFRSGTECPMTKSESQIKSQCSNDQGEASGPHGVGLGALAIDSSFGLGHSSFRGGAASIYRWHILLKTAAVTLLSALPFLCLQLALNRGVTGSWLKSPVSEYVDRYAPGSAMGFAPLDAGRRPQTKLLQKQVLYDRFTVPAALAHRQMSLRQRLEDQALPHLLGWTLPAGVLAALAPLALLIRRRAVWVLGAALPLFVGLYLLWPFLLLQYCIAPAAALIGLVVAGKRQLEQALGAPRWLSGALTATLFAACILALPGLGAARADDCYPTPLMTWNWRELPAQVQAPAVVLFRYDASCAPWEEPVYNWDTCWPDDAPIIRAHDLGPQRNRELIDYYTRRQPGRSFYLYDRATGKLERLAVVAP